MSVTDTDRRVKVLHVIPSLDPADGGPSVAVPMLARAVASAGVKVTILTTSSPQESQRKRRTSNTERRTPNEHALARNDGVEYIYTRRSTNFYKISWELVGWLNTNIRNFDLLHIHALFSFSSTAAALIAAKNKVPYIIRPLGVLNRWGLENRRSILKRASIVLLEKRILSRAAAIHYTSEAERSEASQIGNWVAELPSFVSPLPVSDQGSGVRGQKSEKFFAKFPQTRGKQIVLFLSRIDRKKGIELLFSAFAILRKEIKDVVLVIAGSGDRHYETFLRGQAEQLGISADVVWTSFVSGEEKAAVLAAADLFVLPSYSENFGIAAAEALAAGKPCVLTDQVGIALEASRENAAIVIRCDQRELADAIKNILADPERRGALGRAALQFAKRSLSIDSIGEQLENNYRRIVDRLKVKP